MIWYYIRHPDGTLHKLDRRDDFKSLLGRLRAELPNTPIEFWARMDDAPVPLTHAVKLKH